MKNTPIVSIITINYNSTIHTLELLDSIKELNYKDYEVIVIDNASKENPERIIKERFSEVIYIRSDSNLGFAGGNNLGIKKAKGRYLFFLNNDTCLKKNIINVFIDRFNSTPEYGVLSPKLLYYGSDRILQYAGFSKINQFTARNKLIGNGEKDEGQYDTFREVAYPHGAAMIVRKSVIDKVGKMPENYFLYYEELDWTESIKRCGYKVGFEPLGEVYHKESMSVGKLNPIKTYYLNRNRIMFMRRNTGSLRFVMFFIFYTFVSLPRNIIKAKSNSIRKSILQGYKDSLFSFGKI